jgi:pimeloyl-ACP methyl ester carboxylesterase
MSKIGLAVFLAMFLTLGCGAPGAKLWEKAAQRSVGHGFRPLSLYAQPFHLSALLKGGQNSELVVYLEGDGRSIVHGQPASDPTPRDAQSLELALLDPAPAVLYLARIGQFQPLGSTPVSSEYWTDKRLSEEAVMAANVAIERVKAMVGAQKIHLVGYSGGGGLAILIAERRSDVATIVTVAGLLDIDTWVRNKNWRPLVGSLNPIKNTWMIAHIPQIHVYGLDDQIIPPELSYKFANSAKFAKLTRVSQDTDHYSGWTKKWPDLLNKYILPLRRDELPTEATPNKSLESVLFGR